MSDNIEELQASVPDLMLANRFSHHPELIPSQEIPDDTDPIMLKRLGVAIFTCIRKAGEAVENLKPFMGRILFLIKTNKLYELPEFGNYRVYEMWMNEGARNIFGIARDPAFKLVTTYETLGELTVEDRDKIGGPEKAYLVAQALKAKIYKGMAVEMVQDHRQHWIEAASNSTVLELRKRLKEEKLADNDQLVPIISELVPMTASARSIWKQLLADPFVREQYGPSDSSIFQAMVESVNSEWMNEKGDAARSKALGQRQAS